MFAVNFKELANENNKKLGESVVSRMAYFNRSGATTESQFFRIEQHHGDHCGCCGNFDHCGSIDHGLERLLTVSVSSVGQYSASY